MPKLVRYAHVIDLRFVVNVASGAALASERSSALHLQNRTLTVTSQTGHDGSFIMPGSDTNTRIQPSQTLHDRIIMIIIESFMVEYFTNSIKYHDKLLYFILFLRTMSYCCEINTGAVFRLPPSATDAP